MERVKILLQVVRNLKVRRAENSSKDSSFLLLKVRVNLQDSLSINRMTVTRPHGTGEADGMREHTSRHASPKEGDTTGTRTQGSSHWFRKQ